MPDRNYVDIEGIIGGFKREETSGEVAEPEGKRPVKCFIYTTTSDKQRYPDRHTVLAWHEVGSVLVGQPFGARLRIEGRLTYGSYKKGEVMVYTTEVTADKVHLLGVTGSVASKPAPPPPQPESEDDLPF